MDLSFIHKSKIFTKNKKIIFYFIIGTSASLVDVLFYVLLFNVIGLTAVKSTIVSISIATVYAFILNAKKNFQVEDYIFLRFISYCFVSGVGMLLSIGMLYYFHNKLGFDGNSVKILSLPLIFFVQYFLNKNISFWQNKNI